MSRDSGQDRVPPLEAGSAAGQGPPTSGRHRPPEAGEPGKLAGPVATDFSWVGEARRIDAHLRHRFPHLVTKLYEVKANHFLITFDPSLQKVSTIEKEFHNSIRFVTVAVDLANEEPETYVREIPPLSDAAAIGQLTGLPLTRFDLINLLSSRFPFVDFVGIAEVSKDRRIQITLGTELDAETHAQVRKFVESFELPVVFSFSVSPNKKERNFEMPSKAALRVVASRLRPNAPSYVPLDEAFWFDNIASISANEFALKSFPGLRDDVFRCYLDLTVAQDQMNLRQAVLLYDEVWCSLPLGSVHEEFLSRQALTESDLLDLVESGRLRFVTTQPEERLNVRFLEAAYERDSSAILGRRTTAALLVSDIVRTAEASFLNDRQVISVLPSVCDVLGTTMNREPQDLLRVFLWPLASRRGSLHGLLDRGSWGSPVMDLAQIVARDLASIHGLDLKLELMTLSPPVHIAHALDATLFGSLSEPSGWNHLRSLLGWYLNFHRNFNQQTASSWIQNEGRRQRGHLVVPAMRLFEFDRRIPITEVVRDTSLWSTRAKGRSLYSRLSNLPDDERKAEIDALEEALRKRAGRAGGTIIDLDSADTIAGIGSLVLEFVWPPIVGSARLAGGAVEALRRVRKIDRAMMRLEESVRSSEAKRDLDFLSRIARVATFRRDRI